VRKQALRAVAASAVAVAGVTAAGSLVEGASASSGSDPGGWAALRNCESGGNYATDIGNAYYGAYQFSLQTWPSLGFSGLPSNASPATQDAAAQQLYAEDGSAPWPTWGALSRPREGAPLRRPRRRAPPRQPRRV
jgi:resuscitation-promoting factor RpfA